MQERWQGISRIIDANLNRAREAARVAEDYSRFILDEAELSGKLKDIRHGLRDIAEKIDGGTGKLLASRDTPGDIGTTITAGGEWARETAHDVAAAALKRLQEALRTIEEYAKTEHAEAAATAESLRYMAYDLESAMLAPAAKLHDARLYVIVTKSLCKGRDPVAVTELAIKGGAKIVQLREKEMEGREFLELARKLRDVTKKSDVLFIVNDRVDIAAAAHADGVHLGQGDLPIKEARRLLGRRAIIGVSTHFLAEAQQAKADGADYIGAGTIFATQTKVPKKLAGAEYVKELAGAKLDIPFYPIGGMNAESIPKVTAAGADRAAVCTAIISADDIEAAASQINRQLRSI